MRTRTKKTGMKLKPLSFRMSLKPYGKGGKRKKGR